MYLIAHLFSRFIFDYLTHPAHFRGVGEGMNLLELPDGDLRIDLGGVQFRMPKELLDVADTGQSFTREPPEKTCGLTASSARSSSRPQRCLYRRGFCNHFHQ